MSGFVAVYRRELAGMFLTPLAWVLLFVALFLNGYLFLGYVETYGGDVDAALRLIYGASFLFWATVAFVPPLLTMRMISEEARSGMLEFLLTAPVTDAAVVTAKFLAATTVMAILWSCVLVYGFVVQSLGTAPDWSAVIGGYVGAILVSALFCGIGIVWSAAVSTPLLAAFLAFVSNLVFLLLPFSKNLTSSKFVHAAIDRVDVAKHFQNSFLLGIVDSARVVFFVAWTAFFVFMAVRAVETRRWR